MDLISRQDVIDAINDLPNTSNGYSDTYDKAQIMGMIEQLPSADPHQINIEIYAHDMGVSLKQAEKELQVYPWIQCSECRHCDNEMFCHAFKGLGRRVKADEYCSSAERKGG